MALNGSSTCARMSAGSATHSCSASDRSSACEGFSRMSRSITGRRAAASPRPSASKSSATAGPPFCAASAAGRNRVSHSEKASTAAVCVPAASARAAATAAFAALGGVVTRSPGAGVASAGAPRSCGILHARADGRITGPPPPAEQQDHDGNQQDTNRSLHKQSQESRESSRTRAFSKNKRLKTAEKIQNRPNPLAAEGVRSGSRAAVNPPFLHFENPGTPRARREALGHHAARQCPRRHAAESR